MVGKNEQAVMWAIRRDGAKPRSALLKELFDRKSGNVSLSQTLAGLEYKGLIAERWVSPTLLQPDNNIITNGSFVAYKETPNCHKAWVLTIRGEQVLGRLALKMERRDPL